MDHKRSTIVTYAAIVSNPEFKGGSRVEAGKTFAENRNQRSLIEHQRGRRGGVA